MLDIESPADRAGLFYDGADIALFAQVPALNDQGQSTIIVERNVLCRFDRSYQLINNHEGYHPVMLCQDEDMAYVRQNHRVMLKGSVWKIEERQPDGLGLTQCVLKLLGKYRFDQSDPSVQQGFPYTLPILLGPSAGSTDENLYFPYSLPFVLGPDVGGSDRNPIAINEGRLAYPYTINTFVDFSGHTVKL